MSLELFIHGPGYGETIILRWRNQQGDFEGALVDGYSLATANAAGGARERHWLAARLRELGLRDLQFLAVTHPHNDHLFGLADALREWGGTVAEAWYWNQLAPELYLEYFDVLRARLQKESRNNPGWEYEWPGEEVMKLLVFLCDRSRVQRLVPILNDGGDWKSSVSASGENVLIRSIAPWFSSAMAYSRDVCRTYKRGRINYEQPRANRASLGLVVTYGKARIVLGGDMEALNWRDYASQTGSGELSPCVVKVSHHGSSNGRIDGMWGSEGFFNRRADGAVAVVTPWRPQWAQIRQLPQYEVIHEIQRAGFRVYETGAFQSGGIEHSYVHIIVFNDGTPPDVNISRVGERETVRVYPPLNV